MEFTWYKSLGFLGLRWVKYLEGGQVGGEVMRSGKEGAAVELR